MVSYKAYTQNKDNNVNIIVIKLNHLEIKWKNFSLLGIKIKKKWYKSSFFFLNTFWNIN